MGHVAQIRNLSALLPEPQDLGPVRPSERPPRDQGEASDFVETANGK